MPRSRPEPKTGPTRRSRSGWFALICVLVQPAMAQQNPQAVLGHLQRLLDHSPNPGLVVAVARDRELVLEAGLGLRDVETGTSATAGMAFRNGSTTKMMVAAALVEVLADNGIAESAPLAEYVDGLHPSIGSLSVTELLTHTSGLADQADDFGVHDETALAENVEGKSNGDFFAEPGVVFSYSNPGYDVAGHVLARLSDSLFADAFRARILEPAGMHRSMFRATMAMTYPFALGHRETDGGDIEVIRPMPDNAAEWPSGLMYTTVGDLARYAMMLMADGVGADGRRVVSAETVRRVTQPRVPLPGDRRNASYGYGVDVMAVDGKTVWHHTGGIAGFVTFLTMLPEEGLVVALMTNGPDGELLSAANDYLLETYAGTRLTLPDRAYGAVDPGVSARLAGDYGQLDVELRLRDRDGRLLRIDESGFENGVVHAIDRDDFVVVAHEEEPAYLHVSWAAGGEPRFLHSGSRALIRFDARAAGPSQEN
jgi:CubicO group peptidase (beta-lactamase class C family)